MCVYSLELISQWLLFSTLYNYQRRRHKKVPSTRIVALHDSDEEQDSLNDTGNGGIGETSSSVPLKFEKRLQKMKDLAKQMPDSQSLHTSVFDILLFGT